MKMFKTISVSILLFTGNPLQVQKDTCASIKGYLCNAQDEDTKPSFSPAKEGGKPNIQNSGSPATGNPSSHGSDPVPGRSLPTLVVAGVSIALVLLCVLIVAVFWYAWKKSQEGSMELNPVPYGEAGVSLRSLSVPENQQEWPFERAVQ